MYALRSATGVRKTPLSPINIDYSRDDTPPPPKYILPSDARVSPMKPYLSGLRWLKVLGMPMKCADKDEAMKFVDHYRFIKCLVVYLGKTLLLLVEQN